MPSLFREAALEAAAEVDEWTGEAFRLLPQAPPAASSGRRDVNARTGADAARDPVPFRGVFIARGAEMHARGRNLPDPTTVPIMGAGPYVRDVVMSLPYRPQHNDIVEREDTGERFRVASVRERMLGRLHLDLAELR